MVSVNSIPTAAIEGTTAYLGLISATMYPLEWPWDVSLVRNPLQNSLMDLEAAVQFRLRIDSKCRQ